MLNKKWALVGAFVLVTALALVACAGTQTVVTVVVTPVGGGEAQVITATPAPPGGGTVRDTIVICLGQEPDSLYSMVSTMATQVQVSTASSSHGWYFDTAYFYGTQMLVDDEFPSFENGGAVEEDGVLSVTFHFKDNIMWSDGVPFTVDDIIFTRDILLDPNSGAASRGLYEAISFEKVDDHTLKVIYPKGLKNPTYFLPDFGSPAATGGEILPKHTLEGTSAADIITSDYARKPDPALGPYVVTDWVEGDHIDLQAVPNWWGGEIKTPHLVFRFIADSNQLMASLLSGECDYGTNDVMSLTQLPLLQQSASRGLVNYQAVPALTWEHIDFNTWPVEQGTEQNGAPLFADARVRQAVAYGTNRQQMTEEILFGEVSPLNSFLPSDHWAFDPSLEGIYAYDPDKAKALLEEVGWADADGDGVLEAQKDIPVEYSCGRGSGTIAKGTPFEFSLWIPVVPSMRGQLATVFQSNMIDLGIKVNLNQVPSASALFADGGPLFARTYQVAEYAFVTGPDPSGNETSYNGMNVWTWDPEKLPDLEPGPTGPFLVGSKILEQQPDLLKGTGITDEMFLRGRPIAADAEAGPDPAKLQFPTESLPEGLSLIEPEQIPEEKDAQEGGNNLGWCNADAAQAMFDGDNLIEPADRTPYWQQAQQIFMEDLPSLPMFQRLNIDAWAKNLCGPQPGPANYTTWNVQSWYFAADGETCPEAAE